MPITTTALVRSTVAFLLVGLLTLVAVIGTALWFAERARQSAEDVVRSRVVRSALADTLAMLQDAETGQRGFLITGNEAYLSPFEAANARIDAEMTRLAGLVESLLGGNEEMERLRKTVAAKMAELAETVALKRAGRDAEAVALVRSDRGKALMDEARAGFAEKTARAEARLSEAVAAQRSGAAALRWTMLTGGVLIVVVVGGSVWTVVTHTRERAAFQRELERLNSGLEERVLERTDALTRANEEIQRFAYIVSHDLRAPLVNIMGFTSELETSLGALKRWADDADDPACVDDARRAVEEDLPEAIGFIRSSTVKMDGLINAILRLSREGQRNLHPEQVDLGRLIADCSANIRHRLGENEGEVVLAPGFPTIVSDRMALDQVFANLFDNALKYRSPARAPRITVSAKRLPGGRVAVDVADNGRGIAPGDHERVFELFRRAGAQDQPGEGIGLAHVRAMVRRLGGDIRLQSTLGQGTTFSVVLPPDLRTVKGKEAA